jgi:hypothetical protein
MYSSGCSSCSASSARPSYSGYASSRSASSPTYVSVGTQRYFANSGNASAVAASPAAPRSNGTATPVRYVEYRKPSLFGLSR